MSPTHIYIGAAAMVLMAVGMWLMLPRGNAPGRLLGVLLGIGSLVLFAGLGMRMESAGTEFVYGVLAVVTIVSAAATVTFNNPVYCAIWFALSLLSTAGLFMLQGAQFLGVATVVVYAGAILVTFLFVLMLAQPEGQAYYDRVSWEGMLSATAGAVLVGVLTMTFTRILNPPVDTEVIAAIETFELDDGSSRELRGEHVRRARVAQENDTAWIVEVDLLSAAPELSTREQEQLSSHLLANMPTFSGKNLRDGDVELLINRVAGNTQASAEQRQANILSPDHVAHLGGDLFGRHLIAIEVAGTLLLVALVGAIAIVSHGKSSRALNAGTAAAAGNARVAKGISHG